MAARKCRACKTKLKLYYKDKKSEIFLCGTCRVLLIPRKGGYLPIEELPPPLKKKAELPRGHNGCPVVIREREACRGWQGEADRQKYGCADCPNGIRQSAARQEVYTSLRSPFQVSKFEKKCFYICKYRIQHAE